MLLHPHLSEFNDDITLYRDVRIFYTVPGRHSLWFERIASKDAEIEGVLVLVKVRDRFYRYLSPQPLDIKLRQIELAQIIQRKLVMSSRFQISVAISGIASRMRVRSLV